MRKFLASKLVFCLLIFLLVKSSMLVRLSAEELELELTEAKAHYTVEVVKHIEWPNESELTEFVVAILGNERGLFKAFQERESTSIRGKKFRIEEFDEKTFSTGGYNIVFIVYNKRSLNRRLFKNATDTLIIVDGRVNDAERMVSLIAKADKLDIRLNRENLVARGFDISVSLLEFAGTKEDLGEELRARQSSLRQLQLEVSQKQAELEKLNSKLNQSNLTLQAAERELKNKQELLEFSQSQLFKLEQEIAASREEVDQNEEDIEKQKSLIKLKQDQVKEKERQVVGLQKSIDENRQILADQFEKISQQIEDIQSRDETILTQRTWMQVILVVSIIFVVMSYVLLKMNKLRKQANQDLKKVNSQLFELATTDSLTELSNRRFFLESAQNELLRTRRKKTLAVLLMMDIDEFKQVNDLYGHITGDRVIKAVAEVLKSCMRRYDIVGRLGGEEYAMMLMDCGINQATEIANRILTRVAETEVRDGETKVTVTVSIGLSPLYVDDTDIEQALGRADKALYKAKEGGRNQITIFEELISDS